MQLVIKVTRTDELTKFPELAGVRYSEAMAVAIDKLVGDAKQLSPAYNGFFREGFATELREAVTGVDWISGRPSDRQARDQTQAPAGTRSRDESRIRSEGIRQCHGASGEGFGG